MMIERSGEFAGLATSALWVVSSLAFAAAGRRMGATRLNLLRSLLAASLLLVLHWFLKGTSWPSIGADRTWYLGISGLLGLAIGDQFLFAGYVLVGARTTTLLMTLAPTVAASLSWIVFGQAMMLQAIVGMVITLLGVLWVAAERPHATSVVTPAQQIKGIWFGAAAALCQGVGMVLASNGLRGDIDAISAQTVRMSAGAVGIIVIAFVVSRMNRATRNAAANIANSNTTTSNMTSSSDTSTNDQSLVATTVKSKALARANAFSSTAIVTLLIGTFTGPILGVWCSLYALQKLEVGIATTLMSLVPVMILPVTRITEGRWPSARAILGAFIAVAGVAVLATAPHVATP
ncbi:MAG: DMT family transporter [Phycisphaerales bacterium]